jgi:phosphate/sulfate permease
VGSPLSLSDSGAVKFGAVNDIYQNTLLDIPAAIIIGGFCGLLGAFFIGFTIKSGMYRKKYVNTNVKKVCECAFMAFLTATCFYLVVMARSENCLVKSGIVGAGLEEEFRFTCPEG